MLGTAFSATYMQDFTYADGTTDLGDGSTIGSAEAGTAGTIASVQSNELRLTQVNVGNQRASYRIPALIRVNLVPPALELRWIFGGGYLSGHASNRVGLLRVFQGFRGSIFHW